MGPRTSLLLALVVGWAAATAAAQAPDGAPTVLPTTPIAETWVPVAQPAPATPPAPLVPGPASPPAALPAPAAVPPCPTPVPGVTSPPAEAKPPTLEELAKKVEVLGKNLTVTTGDGDFKLVLGGAVVADFLYSTRSPFAPGTPFFLFPKSAFDFDSQTFDAHARQTNVFALFTGPEVFDFKSGGFIWVNLYDNTIVADRYGLLPLVAYGELKNDDWRFAAGLQFDVFNPLNPTVLPLSLLATSGNTGMFRGQARVERFWHPDEDTLYMLTAALSEPVPTTVNDQLRISEDNGIPNLDVRAAVGLGPVRGAGFEAHRPIELGVSASCGQLRTVQIANRVVSHVWGLGADARWAADPRWGIQGEGYIGQGLGSYGASGLANVNPITFQAIRTVGGWVEVWYYWCPDALHTHVGCGIDDPVDADAGPTVPIRNQTCYVTTIWEVTKGFRVGFQASYLRSSYSVLKDNEGFVFQTQFMWKF
ncbi:MAG TPA: hypothetical protein VKD90_15855 [Gemmataceae bacterium]|nr:hypothetical protein [Gemmataceae bacterium]